MTNTQLDIEHLSKSYSVGGHDVQIIADLTFTVNAGEVVSIVGPSGIGKTTLLKCLTGLQSISSGSARIDGKQIDGPPEEMALVFQEYTRSLMPWLTVEKNVRLPLKHLRLPRTEADRRVREALHSVGLDQAMDRYPWQLSGGMQQRVAIARALAYRPEVLVMDEPFASVDAQTRFELEDLCLKIRDEFGMTILLVTHDIDEALYLADKVVVIAEKPATVVDEIITGFGEQRDQLATKADPRFAEARARIMHRLRKD